jgi:hypothetical protein
MLQLLLALATKLGLVIHMVNMVGAYPNGTLEEVIFMVQPQNMMMTLDMFGDC